MGYNHADTWTPVLLRDICERIDYGYTASARWEAAGPKLLRITDIVPDLIDWASVPRCEINGGDLEKYRLRRDDIVIARTGATTGYAKRIRRDLDAVFASYLVRVRVRKDVDARFVGFIVESDEYKRFIRMNLGGAAQPQANARILTSFPLLLPPMSTQQKIAGILSAYDELIENNTRRIEILEEMAQAIYHEWFAHFRFPGHEGVSWIDSPVGRVPEGWAVVPLGDALVLQRGFDLPVQERIEGLVPVYAATGVVGRHRVAKVRGPGVVTGRSGSLGTVMYVDCDYWPLNTTLWVKEFRLVSPLYAFYLLSGLGLESFNSGAAVPTLNRNDLYSLPVVVPPQEMLRQFDTIVGNMFALKSNLRERNTVLSCVRDTLLPGLMSGQIVTQGVDVGGREDKA